MARPVFKITPRVPNIGPSLAPTPPTGAPPAPTYGADALLQLLPGIAPTGAQGLLQNPDPAMMQQQAALPGVLQTLAMALGGGNNVGGAAPTEATGAAATGLPVSTPAAPAPGYNFNYVDYPTPPQTNPIPVRDRQHEERMRNAALTAASFAPLLGLVGGSSTFGGNLFNQLAAGGLQGAQTGSDRAFAEDLQNYQLTSEQRQQEYARARQMAVDTNAGIDRRNNIVDRIADNRRQEEIAEDNKAIRQEQNRIRREGLEMRDRQAEATRKTRERVALITRADRLTPEAEASLAESLRESISLGLTGDDLFRDMTEKERRAAEETAFRNDINLYGINTRADVQREGQATNRYVAELNNSTRRYGIEVGYETAGMRVASQQEIAAFSQASQNWRTEFGAASRDQLLRTRVSLSPGSSSAKEMSLLARQLQDTERNLQAVDDNIQKSQKELGKDTEAGKRYRDGQDVEKRRFLLEREEIEDKIATLKTRAVESGEGAVVSSSTTASTSASTPTTPMRPAPVPAFNRPGTTPSARPNPVAPPGAPVRGAGLWGLKPAAAAATQEIKQAFGVRDGNGYRRTAVDPKGHPSRLAADLMVGSDAAKGDAIAAYTMENADRLGVKYLIWKQHINSRNSDGSWAGWRKQRDRGGITANHFDHVHISYVDDGGGVEITEKAPAPRSRQAAERVVKPSTATNASQRTRTVKATPKYTPTGRSIDYNPDKYAMRGVVSRKPVAKNVTGGVISTGLPYTLK